MLKNLSAKRMKRTGLSMPAESAQDPRLSQKPKEKGKRKT